jgi:channel protein (hemolysin III family)
MLVVAIKISRSVPAPKLPIRAESHNKCAAQIVTRPTNRPKGKMDSEPQLYNLPGFHEPFSAISHLLGAAVFAVLGCLLLVRGRSNPAGLPYLAVYAVSVVLLLSLSGVYHMMVRGGTAHRVMERLDHSAIFVLIAGSFTPIHGILFHGWLRWGPLILIWLLAITGITLKAVFLDDIPNWLGSTLYVAMGWLGLFGGVQLGRRFGFNYIKPLVIGGVAYSIGAIVDSVPGVVLVPGVIHPHELHHIAALMGVFWQWLFIWQIAKGEPLASR